MGKYKGNALNKALVQIKKLKGVTAYRIAKVSGFSNPTINSWITGEREIRESQLKYIAKCFNVDIQLSVTIN